MNHVPVPATACEDMLRAVSNWPVPGSFVQVEWYAGTETSMTRGEWLGPAFGSDGAPGFAIFEYGRFKHTTKSSMSSIYSPYRAEFRFTRFFHQGCVIAITCLVDPVPPITKTEERRVIKGLRKIVGGTDG